MSLGVEEVTALQVAVSVCVIGVDRRQVDCCFNGCGTEVVGDGNGPAEGVEAAVDLRESKVTDAERDFGVCWLDGPFSRGEGWGGLYCGHMRSFVGVVH